MCHGIAKKKQSEYKERHKNAIPYSRKGKYKSDYFDDRDENNYKQF